MSLEWQKSKSLPGDPSNAHNRTQLKENGLDINTHGH